MRKLVSSAISLFALCTNLSCSDDTSSGGAGGGTGAAGTGAGGSGAANTGGTGTGASGVGGTGATGTGGTGSLTCQGKTYACGDGIDNDNDGLIDMQDPECLGPCDNTEDSLFGGIPGQPGPPCKVDCYFDQDSGAGNDDCYWSHVCDPHEVASDYYPEPSLGSACEFAGPDQIIPPTAKTCSELNASQSQACHDYCGPLTPNGCDCFGCCELPAGSGSFVWLGSEGLDGNTVCTLANVGDPTLCHPCQPVANCLNDCKPCEICLGKPDPDPGCDGNGGGSGTGGFGTGGGSGGGQCPVGVQPCGLPNQSPCPADYFCNTGCCYQVPQ